MTSLLLYPLAFVGGLLTILSPCILPVLPFVFARAGRSFWRETAPMMLGLTLAFSVVATLGVAGAAWAAEAADVGRWIALVTLAIVAVALMSPRVAVVLSRPFVRLGARITPRASAPPAASASVRALVVGTATGLLWAPCAGPILGLVVAISALTGGGARAASLFFTFAVGAAVSLALALFAGDHVLRMLRRAAVTDVVLRRTLAGAALAGVAIIALGWDGALFSGGGLVETAFAESVLVKAVAPNGAAPLGAPAIVLPDEGEFPPLVGATGWLNSAPLTVAGLRGKVVVVDFWTFECYNCRNALPYVKALEKKYRGAGVVVLGIHTPELARERVVANVVRATHDLDVVYPVAIDNNYTIWNAFHNQYWPAVYIVDKRGRIRYHHFGEGSYAEQESVVKQLLAEPGLP